MPHYPKLSMSAAKQQVTETFGGYNHNLKIADGELYDMKNLTSSCYPLLANREKRGTVSSLVNPQGMLAKAALAYVDGTQLYYDGSNITQNLTAAGFLISDEGNMIPKSLVSMGAYLVIFPDRLYINTEDYTDCGSMEASFTGESVSYSLCREDGTALPAPVVSASEPESPSNGALWVDTSGDTHTLRQYGSTAGGWTETEATYVKLSAAGIGAGFRKYDGVTLSGCCTDAAAVSGELLALNGSKIICERGDDYIVVSGMLDLSCTQSGGSVSVTRAVPDMDFVTEAENRLWGCKYGLVNGRTVNEIYCCALGDFTNWSQFLGASTDSYRASVGTDGAFTGAVTYLGYPIFFKENCLHKVYVSATGAHRIVDTACRGVQAGSGRSLAVVNELLYYKSRADVCAYGGSLPVSISQALGTERYGSAAAGAVGDKYYISMQDEAGSFHMFVYDTARGFWHREDATYALCFARCGDELYYIDASTKKLIAVNGSAGEKESSVPWSATTGLMGYESVEKQYVSRFNLRMKLPEGSSADMYIEYDSSGDFRHAGHMEGVGARTFMLPVRPRRCDHFRFRLEGSGEVRVYSMARVWERGSDV